MHGQLFAMAVVGQTIDAGIQTVLTHAIFTNAAIENLQGGHMGLGQGHTFVFHQAPQHRGENLAAHALQALFGRIAQFFVLVIEQAQIHLRNPADSDLPVDL